MKEKTCKSCRKIKPVDDFYENKYSPDGRYAFCKACFDRFAQRLKEKETADRPLNKTCEKCGMVRLIDEFETGPDTASGESSWCRTCREAVAAGQIPKRGTKKGKKDPPAPPIEEKPTQDPADEKPEPPPSPLKEKEGKKPAPQKAAEPPASPAPTPQTDVPPPERPEPEDDFDYIEHLLETQVLEERTQLELLKVPKQITKIRTRRRVCNGCGKIEEIDQVEKNTVIPVRAWFCEFCRQHTTRRWVMKGMTVQDYWGREFKITKIISHDEVIGVLKNAGGKWGKRPLTIYGQWKTHKT